MEMANAVVINKADGDNISNARIAQKEYTNALRLLSSIHEEGWKPKVLTCSALNGEGLDDIWNLVEDYIKEVKVTGYFEEKRSKQNIDWMFSMLEQQLLLSLYKIPDIKKLSDDVLKGKISASQAAEDLFEEYFSSFR